MSDKHETINAVRQYDPAVIKTRIGFYRTLRRKWMMRDMRCIPAIVVKYDPTINIVNVIPLPQRVYKDINGKEIYSNRDIYTVPIVQFNHGGFVMMCPIKAGDTGYLFACDRKCNNAIDLNRNPVFEDKETDTILKENLAPSDDGTICDFDNGFFLPCSWADNIESFNEDGSHVDEDEEGSIVFKTVEKKEEDGDNAAAVEPLKVIIHRSEKEGNFAAVKMGKLKAVFNANGITIESEDYEEITEMTDMRWDPKTHSLQKKVRTFKKIGNIIFDPSEESDWITIENGLAVPEN